MGKVDIPDFVDEYEPPSPPKWKKSDRFNIEDVKTLDDKAMQITIKGHTTFTKLATELTSDLSTDLRKVRALFTWMGHQDIEGMTYPDFTVDHTPAGFMKLVKNKNGTYEQFFAQLCRAAKLPCVILTGKCKAMGYEVGDQDVSRLRGVWNAVFVDESWQIVHPYWAFTAVTGFDSGKWTKIETDDNVTMERAKAKKGVHVRRICEDYFLPHPDEFVYKCIATKKEWQLLDEPWDQQKFCNVPHFQFEYFSSHYKLTSQQKAILTSVDGKCELEFTETEEATSDLDYELFFDEKQSPEKLPSNVVLPRTVFFETNEKKQRLFIRFHMVGIYKLSVGRLAEFRLVAKEKSENENLLPVNPPIGFGFGRTAKIRGIEAPSHTSGVVVTTRNTVEVFRFKMVTITEIMARLRHVMKDSDTLNQYVDTTIEGNMVIIKVMMPDDSTHEEYALQVYTGEEREENNILNYLLTCKQEDFKAEPEVPPDSTVHDPFQISDSPIPVSLDSTLEEIKKDLEVWSSFLLFLYRLFNWNKSSDPAVIFGVSTFLFALLWYYNPPVMTSIALLGLTGSLIYFLLPVVYTNHSRDSVQEKQYEQICEHIMNTRDYLHNFRSAISYFKRERPKLFCFLVLGLFVLLALLGRLFNNLILTYIIVTIILLSPGLYRTGVLQRYKVCR